MLPGILPVRLLLRGWTAGDSSFAENRLTKGDDENLAGNGDDVRDGALLLANSLLEADRSRLSISASWRANTLLLSTPGKKRAG